MTAPTGADVLALQDPDATTQADAVVAIVTALAKSYTRGRGWVGDTPAPDISAAILTASSRLLANVGQLPGSEELGQMRYDVRSGFDGWSLAETVALNRYRITAL